MKPRTIMHKLEFVVLCTLLISFICLFSVEEKRHSSAANEFFVDFNLVGTTWDGDEPEHTGGNNGPWSGFGQIDWSDINTAVSTYGSATIFVFASQYDSYQLITSPIDPHDGATAIDDVTFLGVKSTADSAYWPVGYTTPLHYPRVTPWGCEVVELNVSDSITFENFEFDGCDDEIVVYIHDNADNATFTNCIMNCFGSSSHAFVADSSDELIIRDSKMISNDNMNSDIVILINSDDLLIEDSIVFSNQDCRTFLYEANCEDGTFKRNRFYAVDDVNYSCSFGIITYGSTNMTFETNSIFGYCSNAAVYEYSSNSGSAWNCNTIYNCYISGTAGLAGLGYWSDGVTAGNNLSSFRNNILYATSYCNYGYAIYIDNNFSYWQPASGSFDHNCYYGQVGANLDFGYKNGTAYYDIAAWISSCNDANSNYLDPLLYEGYLIDPGNTPSQVKDGGVSIAGITMDIEKGTKPLATKISIGCDQNFFAVYSTTTAGCSINTGTVPPTVNIGSMGSPVNNPFTFTIQTTVYGYPDPYLNFVMISPASTSYSSTSTFPMLLASGTASDVDFYFYSGITGQETAIVTFFYNTAYSTHADALYFDGWFQ